MRDHDHAPQSQHASLMARVAAGRDRNAYTALFDHFAPRINGFLQKQGMEAGAAEDLTQEVMAVMWHKAHLFDPAKSSLATWLFRVARNRRIDGLRRDRSHLIDPHDPFFQPDPAEAPDTSLDGRQRDERVRLALASVPDEQMGLIRLAFFNGLTHSQIAERTGLPLGTVKSRIRLAFARLRRALETDPKVDADG